MLPSDGRGGGSKAAALEAADADGKEGSSRRWSPVTCIAPRRSAAAGSPPRAEPGRAAASGLLSPPRPNQGTEPRPEASAGNLGPEAGSRWPAADTRAEPAPTPRQPEAAGGARPGGRWRRGARHSGRRRRVGSAGGARRVRREARRWRLPGPPPRQIRAPAAASRRRRPSPTPPRVPASAAGARCRRASRRWRRRAGTAGGEGDAGDSREGDARGF